LQSFTIPDYFHLRYQSDMAKFIRVLSAFIILFATVWYMVGIAKGCAVVLETVLEVPYLWGAAAILFITCAYTIWGGMYSVLWTDALQGIIMFGVAILMLALPFIFVGGVEPMMAAISDTTHTTKAGEPMGNGLVTFGSLVSFLYILGIGLSIGMKQISEPKNLIRFYSVDNAKSMRFAMIWTPVFLGISLVCVMGLGALVHGMATAEEAAVLIQDTDKVVGFMLDKFDNKFVRHGAGERYLARRQSVARGTPGTTYEMGNVWVLHRHFRVGLGTFHLSRRRHCGTNGLCRSGLCGQLLPGHFRRALPALGDRRRGASEHDCRHGG